MKKITAILFVAVFLAACGNDSNTDNNSNRDTSHSTVAPDNTISNDTMNRAGDTSSYERMPQKKVDSVPQ